MPTLLHTATRLLTMGLSCSLALAGDPIGGDHGAPLSLTSLLAQDSAAATTPPAATPVEVPQAATTSDQPEFRSYPLYPSLTHKFELKIGGAIYGRFDTKVQVNSDAGVGATVDFEDLLGLDKSSNLFRTDMSYAFNPRHEIIASYYDIRRTGTRTLPEDITIGGVTFPGGQSIDTGLSTTILKISYLYNFITDNRTKLGVSFGLYNMLLDMNLNSSTSSIQESFKGIAPMPVVGLHGKYALGKRWNVLASAQIFQVDVGVANGRLIDTILALENDLFEHVGWGVALNTFGMDVSIDGDNALTADLQYDYQGLLLYLRFFI